MRSINEHFSAVTFYPHENENPKRSVSPTEMAPSIRRIGRPSAAAAPTGRGGRRAWAVGRTDREPWPGPDQDLAVMEAEGRQAQEAHLCGILPPLRGSHPRAVRLCPSGRSSGGGREDAAEESLLE
ncbi:hypothetical protein NDU88_007457 [Pleurodeles waltl]|uniref:Uncharacterized protein n=1 Tax=Pleurodeles waltl TaxID=8319 RepID=A0AAV7VPT6_PLEWA|nr:hypothetical protein NDU88_007457 [Pleurodeles waltl]